MLPRWAAACASVAPDAARSRRKPRHGFVFSPGRHLQIRPPHGGWGLSSNTLLDTERRPEVVTPSGELAVIRQTAGATMWTCTGARPVLRWCIDATTSRSP